MGSPKTVKRFNSEWFALFDRFIEDENAVIEVECGTPRAAKAMRLEFYKIRQAIVGTEQVPPEDPELAAMYAGILNSREVAVPKDGTKCVFSHKDRNWIGQVLAKALEEAH